MRIQWLLWLSYILTRKQQLLSYKHTCAIPCHFYCSLFLQWTEMFAFCPRTCERKVAIVVCGIDFCRSIPNRTIKVFKVMYHFVHCTGMYQRVIVVWRIVPKHALIWCSMMQNRWYNVKQCYFQMTSFKGRKTGSRVLLETNRSSFGSVYTYQML